MNITKEYFEKAIQRLATKEDLKQFSTKDDLKKFATKNDLKKFATKQDLKGLATQNDLARFATKEDIKELATKQDVRDAVEEVARMTNDGFMDIQQRFSEIPVSANLKILSGEKNFGRVSKRSAPK